MNLHGSNEVHVILDPCYDGNLWAVSEEVPVWICSSESNDARVRVVMERERSERSPRRSVTRFAAGDDDLAAFFGLLGVLEASRAEPVAPWTAIHVAGLSAREVSVARILEAVAAESLSLESDYAGFTVRRTLRAPRARAE